MYKYICIYIYIYIYREREAHIMILHSLPHSQDDTPNVLWEPTFMAIAALPLHRALDLQLQYAPVVPGRLLSWLSHNSNNCWVMVITSIDRWC